MLIGITEEQFWEMNPNRLKPYLKADDLRRERENHLAWLNGLYVYNAVSSALSAMGKKKHPYLKEPIPFTVGEIEEAERKKEERMKRQFATFVDGLKRNAKFSQ